MKSFNKYKVSHLKTRNISIHKGMRHMERTESPETQLKRIALIGNVHRARPLSQTDHFTISHI